MPVHRARAEFRRRTRESPWVLAGVRIGDRFWPAQAGVEPIRRRLPEPGLLGWVPLDAPIIAPDTEAASRTALQLARDRWPERVRHAVPFAAGADD